MTILITGASSGLGNYLAKKFVSSGHHVLGIDIQNDNDIIDSKFTNITIDITDENIWDDVIKNNYKKFEKIHTVVSCAGSITLGNIENLNLTQFSQSNLLNISGHFLTTKKVIPFLKLNKGNMIYIGSSSARFAAKNEVAYITAKHALLGLNKSVAIDYGHLGIRSNIINPGWIDTPMSRKEMNYLYPESTIDEAFRKATANVPLQKAADLKDIYNAVEFISSNKAKMITGSEINIDGGAGIVDVAML